jgi:hypothetical protein
MPKLTEQMPMVVAMHQRTQSIYDSMRKRFAGKTDKRGRVLRPARLVPFTLAEFRAWLLEQFGGKAEGSVPCEYCRTPLFAETFRVDHPDPVSRGGTLGFENLCCACDRCNRMKGSLTASEFHVLKIVLGDMLRAGTLHPAGFSDIEKRLCGQTAIFRKFQKPAKPKPTGLLVEEAEQTKLPLTRRTSLADSTW